MASFKIGHCPKRKTLNIMTTDPGKDIPPISSLPHKIYLHKFTTSIYYLGQLTIQQAFPIPYRRDTVTGLPSVSLGAVKTITWL
jgi:hypothetical protein